MATDVKDETTESAALESLDAIFGEPVISQDVGETLKEKVATSTKETTEKKTDEKVDEKAEVTDETKTDETTEAKTEDEQKELGTPDWEAAANPYKKRHQDTFKWANDLNQQLAEINRQQKVTQQKIDGTYDEEAARVAAPSPEVLQAQADQGGRVKASYAAAYDKYGQEETDKLIASFDQLSSGNAALQSRVYAADLPVIEAIKILEEHAFTQKWGSAPAMIEANIRKETAAEYEKKIEDEVEKRITQRLNKKGEVVQGLSGVRGSVATSAGSDASAVESTAELFS